MDEENLEYERLLLELYNSDVQLAGIISTKFDKTTSDKVGAKVAAKDYEIKEQAKKYGQQAEVAAEAVEKYGEGLEIIRQEFSTGKNAVLMQNANLNKTEIKNLKDARKLQLEIKQEQAEGLDVSSKKEMLEGCKVIATSAKEGSKVACASIDDIAAECNGYIDEIANDTKLVVQDKRNKVSTFFSNIFAKVGGKRKFDENVVAPLEEKTQDIQESKIAEAQEKVKESLVEKIQATFKKMEESINEFGKGLSEKVKQLDVKKVVQSLLLTATGAAVVVGLYSPVSFGVDVTSTFGSWLSERNSKVKEAGTLEIN